MSTYTADYVASKVYTKLPPITPKENGIIYSSDDCLQSSYNEEYVSKVRGNQLPSFKPHDKYEKGNEMFTTQSSYKEDFISHQTSKQKSLKPILNYSLPTEAFTTSTNYKNEFTGKRADFFRAHKPLDSYPQCRSHESSLIRTHTDGFGEGLNGNLTSRSNDLRSQEEGIEDWSSNYRSDFTKPSHNENAAAGCSSKTNKLTNLNDFPEEALHYFTNYNESFNQAKPKTERALNFKPKTEYKVPDKLFDSISSYATDFVKVITKPNKSFKPVNVYQPPEPQTSSKSVYSDEFSSTTKSPRVKPIVPNNQIQFESKEMDFVTDYGSQFNRHPGRLIGDRATEFRPNDNYEFSSDPFSATSTYGHEFKKGDINEKVKTNERKGETRNYNDGMEYMSKSKKDF